MLVPDVAFCMWMVAGGLQGHRGHSRADEPFQEASCSKNNGELLPEAGHGVLEGWQLLVPCCRSLQVVPAVQGDEEEHHT